MKKCFYFPTWEEQKDVIISLDEGSIYLTECIQLKCDNCEYKETWPSIQIKQCLYCTTPSDPILAKLCELTGAKMYGDYVILEKALLETNQYVMQGDYIDPRNDGNYFICIKHPKFIAHSYGKKTNYWNTEFLFYGKRYTYDVEFGEEPFMNAVSNGKTQIIGNIFKEYSKFIYEEENKWEEVRKVLEI